MTPNAEYIIGIHYELVKLFIEDDDPIFPPGPKNENLIHSAADRPYINIGGMEKYTTYDTKVACLFHSLIQNHPFHNGNKRTALVTLLVALDLNSRSMEATDDDIFDFVVAVAGRKEPFGGNSDNVVDEISAWVRKHCLTRNNVASNMPVSDFLSNCKNLGCKIKETSDGRAWSVLSPFKRSIRFNKKHETLDGNVVRKYLKILNLTEPQAGIYLDEFQNGIGPEHKLIIKYRTVLRRLSHA
ncbi:type II toxin-antitoxin system death-on-curing family toxin [Paenibacillus apii]|uniref:type II toxin-antitoxin system death-on-curing family toxin n=1 Tax=Paenibacillus apii TaxID=1850370 RepID=UPI001439A229|nr:type II toxin-antitoxin system death-on-curing family toxin [Paenibacillus apii]NJJ41404.1 type II toxin-antitoxin system death-on-curing family toxin [Paenibacillus apii]